MGIEGRAPRLAATLALSVVVGRALVGCAPTRGDLLIAGLGAADGGPPVEAGPPPDGGPPVEAAPPTDGGVTEFYIAPDGNDTGPGTAAAPWKTFAHALPLLRPGLTLVLLDGVYTSETSGMLQVFCGQNAVDGEPGRPIVVRAQNERRAFVRGDGAGAAIELSACSHWTIEGLHAEGADVPGEMGDEPGSVVVLTHGCSDVVLRRIVAARPNRTLQASVYVIAHAATNVLVEECEALDFHYYGFHAYDSTHPIFRRDYAHSRDVTDAPGGMATSDPIRGDGGFLLTKSASAVIENCVAEHVADGFTIAGSRVVQGGRVQPQHDQILGCISNDATHAGFRLLSRCNGTKPCNEGDRIVSDSVLSNDVAIGGPLGFSSEGAVHLQIANASIFDVTDTGVSFGLNAENMGLTSSASARASLATAPGAAFGFHATAQFEWSFQRCNAFGAATPFAPRDAAHVDVATEVDPQLAGCLVYVPPGSPVATAGVAGASLGARVVARYADGQLTSTPLWDPATGAFPCGAAVSGLNDDTRADVSCIGVHARLHVGTGGCALP
jgi:hypothetical protein